MLLTKGNKMNILISAATHAEVGKLLDYLNESSDTVVKKSNNIFEYDFYGLKISFVITGVGQVASAYNVTKMLVSKQYDLAINLGICGAFPESNLNIGDVVEIKTEIFGDFGVDDHGNLKTVFDMGLVDPEAFPFQNGELHNPADNKWIHPFVEAVGLRSLTVSLVSGELTQIVSRKQKFSVDVENMEGAAFFYVCLSEKVPFIEIRSVSNLVEPRKREKWQIPLAIDRLFDASKFMIMELASKN